MVQRGDEDVRVGRTQRRRAPARSHGGGPRGRARAGRDNGRAAMDTTLRDARSVKAPARARPYAWYALGLMSVIYLLDAMDQSILSAFPPSIQGEFLLSDTQVAVTASAFILVLAAAALLASYLAAR